MQTFINSKGQINIPPEIRKQLRIKDGTYLQIEVNNFHQIILTPITREFIRNLRGKYKGQGLMKALVEEKEFEKRY
jgi:AbrB family looped-hinge helix DNA binding protein